MIEVRKMNKQRIKSYEVTAKEIAKLPASTSVKKEKSNHNCGCGRNIAKDDIYYIRVEPGEPIEVFCEFCVSLN